MSLRDALLHRLLALRGTVARLDAPAAADWRPGQGLSRRAVLRGAGRATAAAVALPPLAAMFDASGTAYACDGVFPVRFGLWFWGNGTLPERWVPANTGEGDAWELSEQLAPLAPIKHKLALVTGLACKVPNISPHGSGAACLLTAGPDLEDAEGNRMGPSIDQVIAAGIGGTSIYKSVITAATNCTGESWSGPASRNPAETDPYALYARLFGDTFIEPGEDGLVDPRLGLRRSVLDLVMDDIAALQPRLGAEDRARLEQHLDGVREIEQRLAILEENPPNLEACSRPASPTEDFADVDGRARVYERNRAMSQLLAMAFACDQTRVFAHFLTAPVSDVLFPDAPAGHHDLTHNEGGEQAEVNDITKHVTTMFCETLQILDAIPEGDGTVLDHCAILGASEVSLGQTHSIENMPTIIGGSACGFFRQDIHHRSVAGESTTRLLIGLQRAMGMPVSSFGFDDAAATDSIPEIEA
jgi:hypothetical protein